MLWIDLRRARSAQASERAAAAADLSESTDPRAVACLAALLEDADSGVQRAAIEALSRGQSPEAIPALVAATRKRDDRVVVKACEALGAHRDPRVVTALVEVAAGNRAVCWKAATRALLELGWSPGTPRERAQVAVSQGRWPPRPPTPLPDLEALLALVRDERTDPPGLAGECVALVAELGAVAIPVLREAAVARSRRHDFDPWDKSPDPARAVRRLATMALGAIDDPAATQALFEMAANLRTPEEDEIYCEALVSKGHASVAVLRQFLAPNDGSSASQQTLWVRALSRIPDPNSLGTLARLHFEASDSGVRAAAEVALGAIDSAWPRSKQCRDLVPRYIGTLRSYGNNLTEDPGRMEWNAEKALEAMSGQSFGFDADRWQEWWDRQGGD